jgi:hypothetical protein
VRVIYRLSFAKDLKKIRSKKIRQQAQRVLEAIEHFTQAKNHLIARRLIHQQARRRQPPDSALRYTDQIAERTTSRLHGCQDVSGTHAFYPNEPSDGER